MKQHLILFFITYNILFAAQKDVSAHNFEQEVRRIFHAYRQYKILRQSPPPARENNPYHQINQKDSELYTIRQDIMRTLRTYNNETLANFVEHIFEKCNAHDEIYQLSSNQKIMLILHTLHFIITCIPIPHTCEVSERIGPKLVIHYTPTPGIMDATLTTIHLLNPTSEALIKELRSFDVLKETAQQAAFGAFLFGLGGQTYVDIGSDQATVHDTDHTKSTKRFITKDLRQILRKNLPNITASDLTKHLRSVAARNTRV